MTCSLQTPQGYPKKDKEDVIIIQSPDRDGGPHILYYYSERRRRGSSDLPKYDDL